ncbi:MAG: hypothetical protein JWP15_3350 [Alphaproteobacteria bacterium]|nr:hypothetical protein [Alphaproteobacteria bacterium]
MPMIVVRGAATLWDTGDSRLAGRTVPPQLISSPLVWEGRDWPADHARNGPLDPANGASHSGARGVAGHSNPRPLPTRGKGVKEETVRIR